MRLVMVTVVAKVNRAVWELMFLLIPQSSAISLR